MRFELVNRLLSDELYLEAEPLFGALREPVVMPHQDITITLFRIRLSVARRELGPAKELIARLEAGLPQDHPAHQALAGLRAALAEMAGDWTTAATDLATGHRAGPRRPARSRPGRQLRPAARPRRPRGSPRRGRGPPGADPRWAQPVAGSSPSAGFALPMVEGWLGLGRWRRRRDADPAQVGCRRGRHRARTGAPGGAGADGRACERSRPARRPRRGCRRCRRGQGCRRGAASRAAAGLHRGETGAGQRAGIRGVRRGVPATRPDARRSRCRRDPAGRPGRRPAPPGAVANPGHCARATTGRRRGCHSSAARILRAAVGTGVPRHERGRAVGGRFGRRAAPRYGARDSTPAHS